MPVGLLTLEIHIPDAQSLKDKRQVLRSLKDKLRRQFNVAVAELDHHDTWQRSVVGVVTLSNEEKHVQESLQKVPVSVTALSGDYLNQIGANDLNDYFKYVPGINYAPAASGDRGGQNIVIRGVSNSDPAVLV